MERVGFVGAGRMGRPMVRRLVDASYQVTAVARSVAARRELDAMGAGTVAETAEAGDGAGAVLVCVRTDQQVRDVCLTSGLLERMPAGSLLVIHTTAGPATMEAVARRAAEHGIDTVDAPVSGGPDEIARGRLTLFAGGTEHGVSAARTLLETYGDPVLHVGPIGAGQRVKLINNALFAAHLGLLSEAVRLGREMGIAETDLLHALPHASAASRALSGVRSRGSVATFAASVAEFLDKDLRVVQDVAAEIGSDLGAIEPALTALERLVEAAGAAPRPRHTPVEPGSRRNDRVPTPSPLRPIG